MRIFVGVQSLLFLTATAAVAHAHASLAQASPSVGSAISAPPQEVILTFTERLEPAFSKLTVIDTTGAEVSHGQGASQRRPNAYRSQAFECGNLQGELARGIVRHPQG